MQASDEKRMQWQDEYESAGSWCVEDVGGLQECTRADVTGRGC